jgi:hypothetical protein
MYCILSFKRRQSNCGPTTSWTIYDITITKKNKCWPVTTER